MNGLLSQNALGSFSLDGVGGSNIKSIQSGTAAPTATSQTITISAIDMTKSIVKMTSNAGTGSNLSALMPKIVITNSTTLTITFQSTPPTTYLYWEVIEFNNVKSLQSGVTAIAASTSPNITISSINLSKSTLFFSADDGVTANTNYIEAAIMGKLLDTTTLNFSQSSSVARNAAWYVIEFN